MSDDVGSDICMRSPLDALDIQSEPAAGLGLSSVNTVSKETSYESLESRSQLATWKAALCDILCECPRGVPLRES
jgi:hypothetical protein